MTFANCPICGKSCNVMRMPIKKHGETVYFLHFNCAKNFKALYGETTDYPDTKSQIREMMNPKSAPTLSTEDELTKMMNPQPASAVSMEDKQENVKKSKITVKGNFLRLIGILLWLSALALWQDARPNSTEDHIKVIIFIIGIILFIAGWILNVRKKQL